ncbi:MAG TPA: YggT family protein [Gemmatimonadales bacterium]|jgi:YggT family protein|nr:YggT family protein [Gemmatimonadales bacterium]
MAGTVYLVLRVVIVAALAVAAIVALTHWAVRNRRLNAFGAWPRFVRSFSDPLLHPIERRILRAGGNPQSAPLWLLGLVIAGGLLLLWLVEWAVGAVAALSVLSHAGPGAWALALARLLFFLLEIAIIVRVLSSWFGLGPFSRLVRPAFRLTDWIVVPLRRILPPMGPFDLSPLLAWVLLFWVAQPIVLGLLSRLLTPY